MGDKGLSPGDPFPPIKKQIIWKMIGMKPGNNNNKSLKEITIERATSNVVSQYNLRDILFNDEIPEPLSIIPLLSWGSEPALESVKSSICNGRILPSFKS